MKKVLNIDKVIFFIILVIFPFGQIFKFDFINLFDVAILALAVVTFFKKPKYPNWYKYFVNFLFFCAFGLIFNFSLLTFNSLLYLVRFWSYSMVAIYISNFYKKNDILKKLISLGIVVSIFGWLQYLIWPDTRALLEFGWDDHYLRMLGTFLDPAFMGLILVLTSLMTTKYKNNLILNFLTISILFTYSRISYLLLFLILLFNKKFLTIIFFIFAIFLLPKNIGEGTTLARTASGLNKLVNYQESIEIFKKSPILGVGFNNVCSYKNKYLNQENTKSHSCSGFDSSFLFVLATTGLIGVILLIYFMFNIPRSPLLIFSFLVVLVHSIFTNSLFYPHIMFWLFILVGLGGKINRERS